MWWKHFSVWVLVEPSKNLFNYKSNIYVSSCRIKLIGRSSRPEVLCKKFVLKISRNSQENTCARASFLINLQTSGLELYLKQKNLAHVPSCEFCDIFKNTFYRTPPLAVWHCLFFSFSCSKRWNTRLFISNTFFQLNLCVA